MIFYVFEKIRLWRGRGYPQLGPHRGRRFCCPRPCVGRGPIPFDAPWRSAGRHQRQHLASNRYRRTSTILESSVGARARWFATAIRLVCLLMSGGERSPQGEVIAAFEAAGRPLEQRSCACDFVCLTTDDDPAARLRPSESFCRACRWSSRSENRETEARGLWNNAANMRTTSLVPDVGCGG